MLQDYDAAATQSKAAAASKKLMTLEGAAAGNGDDIPANMLDANAKRMGSLLPAIFKAHVEVPTQKDVEAALLHRKKMELLKQYVSDELMETETATQELMETET